MILIKNLTNGHYNIPIKEGVNISLPSIPPQQTVDLTANWHQVNKHALRSANEANALEIWAIKIDLEFSPSSKPGHYWDIQEASRERALALVNANFMEVIAMMEEGVHAGIALDFYRVPVSELKLED